VHIYIQFWAYRGVFGGVGEGPWRHIGASRAFRGLSVNMGDVLWEGVEGGA